MKSVAAVAVCAALAASPAEARIICNDGYQLVQGNEISTPYCRDQYLARIARRSGFNVSDETIRNNPSKKREICRYIGANIEVQPACAEVDGRRGQGY